MKAFEFGIAPEVWTATVAHVEAAYPSEACGLWAGPAGGHAVDQFAEIPNVQDKFHALDPKAFPRTSRDAFRLDDLAHMRCLDGWASSGHAARVLFHSHTDAGAYFSVEDRAMAVQDGVEILPGIIYVVVSVRDGRAVDAAAFRYQAETGGFEERRIWPGDDGAPDLDARAMSGRAGAGTVPPVGGRMSARAVTAPELQRLLDRCSGRMAIDGASAHDVALFSAGLYSPLAGFMRGAEIESVTARRRLLSGTPWPEPVFLATSGVPKTVAPGDWLELETGAGRPAVLAVQAVEPGDGGAVRLAGDVYAELGEVPAAADLRADWARRGATRVLARPHLAEVPDPSGHVAYARPLPTAGRGWLLDALIAQNAGATHYLAADERQVEALAASGLCLVPVTSWSEFLAMPPEPGPDSA